MALKVMPKGAFSYAGDSVLDSFKTRQEMENKLGMEMFGKKLERDQEMQAMKEMTGSSGSNGGFIPESFKVGSMNFKNPQYQEDVKKAQYDLMLERKLAEKAQAGAGTESGRMTLAQESIRNIRDIRNTLFPDGTPASFQRGVALGSNVFGRPVPFGEKGQDVFRKSGAALSGRQLIQTGVAARADETEALRKQFLANVTSNPNSAFKSLDELEAFYNDYLKMADPSELFHQQGKSNITDVSNDTSTTTNKLKQTLNLEIHNLVQSGVSVEDAKKQVYLKHNIRSKNV